MFGKWTLLVLGLVALSTLVLAETNRAEPEPPGNLIDIDTELGKEKDEVPEESGSGKDVSDDEDDEDDLEKSSGSGSGGDKTDDEEPDKPSTSKSLTPCENLREASKHLLGNYVPRCTWNGDYAAMQCRGYPGTGRCWCSDKIGAEIPGTAMDPPKTPDCEKGSNLSPCVFKFVQNMRNPMYGSFNPQCKMNGEFEEMQCHGSVCFCVDNVGEKIFNTEMPIHKQDRASCQPTTTMVVKEPVIIPGEGVTLKADKGHKPHPTKPVDQGYTIDTKIDKVDLADEEDDVDDQLPNETGEDEDRIGDDPMKQETKGLSAHITTQPGLLAAIIGGAVVGLLCAILIVMFLVYRMRKKDEGSYALDEPSRKKSAYSPINQNDKEYYA